jgi:predicted nuclease of restriction endonuclease-like RecB superfamily
LGYAERFLRFYEQGIGETRRDLHRRIESGLASLDDCPSRRIAAFQKLLDEVSVYDTDGGKAAALLRKKVFSAAAAHHPLVSQKEGIFCNLESEIKQSIAADMVMTWEQIDAKLFSDVVEFQRLKSFDGYASPAELLARYNVAQTQAALYRAEQMVVWSRTDHKLILRYAKLARLMHSIRREEDGSYCFRLDGPASVLRRSTRYGVAMAKFLPGLLTCRDWRAQARILTRFGKRYRLELSSSLGLTSPGDPSQAFDSDLEANFVADWEKCDSGGWRLEREADLLYQGQTVFSPDFTLISPQGRRVLLEIVGFWTPEYLLAKSRMLEMFRETTILLAVAEQSQLQLPASAAPPIVFKRRLKPADVLSRLEQM